jgi:FkbM family methyltransferase
MKTSLIAMVSKAIDLIPQGVKRGLYHLGPVSQLIRDFLNRISPTGLNIITVSGGSIKGMKFKLDLQSEKDYWLGTYEVDLQNAILKQVKPGMCAYDIGANIGYISMVLAKAVSESGQVIAFEALPSNIHRLRENIHLNELDSRVRVVHGAVTDSSETVQFLVGPSGAMGKVVGSAGRVGIHKEVIEVPGIDLDEFVYRDKNPIPQVIKMDIEGGEVLALRGMTRVLSEAPPIIFLDLHGSEAAQAAWDALTSKGYKISHMKPDLPIVPSLADLDWKAYLVAIP